MQNDDVKFMLRCFELARLGAYSTFPNPMVGCVIVRDGQVVGEGFHERAGEPHAEVRALVTCGDLARGATLYVNLEPCCHFGRTPPCVDLIIKAGIKKVVIAMQDPNPKVSGQGIEVLRRAGIEVVVDVLTEDARKLNAVFVHYITHQQPFVVAKWAMSLDGVMALDDVRERQISGFESQQDLHELRQSLQGILIGSHTARIDDPFLTVRFAKVIHRQPQRIVLNSAGDLDPSLKLFNGSLPGKTWLVCVEAHHKAALARFDAATTELIAVPANGFGKVDVLALLKILGERELVSVLIEGGRTILNEFFKLACVNEVQCYVAPCWLGGQTVPLRFSEISRIGVDYKIKAIL